MKFHRLRGGAYLGKSDGFFFVALSLARGMWFSAMGVHLAVSSLARGMWFSAMSVPQWTSRSCISYEHGILLRAVSSFRL